MDLSNFYKQFKKKGFFKISNFFDQDTVDNLKSEILEITKTRPKEIFFYTDRNKLIRRIERFYNHTKLLNNINEKVLKLLKDVFGDDYYLFKDKYNFKPPKGEGFYAHYDGIFHWTDKNDVKRKGWHDYADEFINVLIVLDDFTDENGSLEISEAHKGDFDDLIKNTKKNGTPDIREDLISTYSFEKMLCKSGSVVIFSSKCPHRSKKNKSNSNRGSLYYTYNPSKFGNHYTKYFLDKSSTKNSQSKSLSGEKD